MKLNHIQVIGRIGQDAKIIDHNSKRFVAFSLAVDESYKDRNGTKVERTTWYDCVTDQERFFNVTNWLTKGREVYVDGKPSVRAYEKEGKPYASIRIHINTSARGNAPTGTTATAPAQTSPATTASAPASGGFNQWDDNTDLPF